MGKILTPGSLLIKRMLPTPVQKHFDTSRVLDKNGIKDLINLLIQHGGDESFEALNSIGQLFFNKATQIGVTTPLGDYNNDSLERQTMLHEFEEKVKDIMQSKRTKEEKSKALSELSEMAREKMEKQNIAYLVSRGSTAARMAQTGARGNPLQLGQGTASPLMAQDVKGNPIPLTIRKSFAEGLSSAEHIAMSYGGRASTVLTQLSTSLPGALFKKLTPNLFHEVISEPDCKTRNGILIPIKDKKSIIGRVQAGSNLLIDEFNYKDLVHSELKEVKMRTPMTCEAKHGVCQKCYGLYANGRFPDIGENVGIVASQSVSEVLTQAMLSTKHKGGVAGGKGNAYDQAHNLLSNPEVNFRDEATISSQTGKVEKIEKSPLGDYNVIVNAVGHFVPRSQHLVVDAGDKIKKGDRISTGTINPRKLVSLVGMGAGRISLSSQLREVYGKDLDPRHFDLIARNLMKYVEVEDPGDSGLMPGQKIDINHITPLLEKDDHTIMSKNGEGRILSKGVLELTPGTILTDNHVNYLQSKGIDHIHVSNSGLKVRPLVPGLQTAKLLDKNWISRLSFSRLQDSLRDAASTGAKSEKHSADPITPFILGTEFGVSDKGRY
jgi:DNA-directed RNA polymerase subunit beta'